MRVNLDYGNSAGKKGYMSFENYSRVRLLVDSKVSVKAGAIGYVIEVYDDGMYEVEFSDRNGSTIAQVVVHENELQIDEPGPIDNRRD